MGLYKDFFGVIRGHHFYIKFSKTQKSKKIKFKIFFVTLLFLNFKLNP